MTYYTALFSQKSWSEFRADGARTAGFRRPRPWNPKPFPALAPGDVLLCYVTGVQRWVGVIEILGTTDDPRPIWSEGDFSLRFDVRAVSALEVNEGVPMRELEGRVTFYASAKDAGTFHGFVRSSPNVFRSKRDAELVSELIAASAAAKSRRTEPNSKR